MALSKNKQLISVALKRDTVAKLDEYAEHIGLTRSALCAYIIGHGMHSIEQSYNLLSSSYQRAANIVSQGLMDLQVADNSEKNQISGQADMDCLVCDMNGMCSGETCKDGIGFGLD